jgi:hypothetical protein
MGFNPSHVSGSYIKCIQHGPYYATNFDVRRYRAPNAKALIILAEPTVLLLCIACFQRIKIRCYKIGRGYASILITALPIQNVMEPKKAIAALVKR